MFHPGTLIALVLAAQPGLRFEVAALKPSAPGERNGGIRPAPGGERYLATNVSLRLMLTVAYRINDDQIVGGPDWMNSEKFDMNAKAAGPSTIEELHVMLQNLLAERFKLQFHRETKERPVYALMVDKGTLRMQPHPAQTAGEPWIEPRGGPHRLEELLMTSIHATAVPMDHLAWWLSRFTDRPVIDRTGLKGGYDFDLAFVAAPGGVDVPSASQTVYECVRPLGLKLERQKGPVTTLVVDHVEQPSEK